MLLAAALVAAGLAVTGLSVVKLSARVRIPNGAGDAAAAIDAGRGEQAVSSFRADDDRRAANRGSS